MGASATIVIEENSMIHTLEKSFITYELASALIKAAMDHAQKQELSICVAVVDPVGNLVAFARMNDACLIGVGTAQGKAFTAARSGLSTRDFRAYLKEHDVCLSTLAQEQLVVITGGLPIMYRGTLIGGIGIGGGSGKQDEECAKAALAAHNLLL
jgi:uncharacterized protein GlcG (DUF336 family)